MFKKNAISIIGGADGPTSVFFAGKGYKEKNILRRLKNYYQNRKYQNKRAAVEKQIIPCAHSLSETIRYIQERYHAVEADASYLLYFERKKQLKYSLLQREKPELIGADKQPAPPAKSDFHNQEIIKEWMHKMDIFTDACMKKAEQISEEAFPIRYRLFIIERGDWKVEIEIEELHEIIGISTIGSGKETEKIMKDIYRYYGVSKDDIEKRTERYMTLVTMLSL